jgi:hypothetical protein
VLPAAHPARSFAEDRADVLVAIWRDELARRLVARTPASAAVSTVVLRGGRGVATLGDVARVAELLPPEVEAGAEAGADVAQGVAVAGGHGSMIASPALACEVRRVD